MAPEDDEPTPLTPEQQKEIALELLLASWEEALDRGVAPELIATTAITAAITDMIDRHGEEAMAGLIETLPGRIRGGEFTFDT